MTYVSQSWVTGDQVTAVELTDLSEAVTSASSGIADMSIDQSTSHLQVTLADGDLVDAGAVPAASDATVAPILQNTASQSYAAAQSAAHAALDTTIAGKVAKGAIVVNAADYGTIGDGAAIDAAIAALGTNQGTVLIPPGTWTLDHTITVPSCVHIKGNVRAAPVKTTASGAPGTTIQYTGTGTAFDLSGAASWGLSDLGIVYTSTAATAPILDLTGPNCAFGHMDRVYISSSDPANNQSAPSLVDLDGSLNIAFRDCRFYGAQTLIQGISATYKYANAVTFHNCFFARYVTASVTNPDKAWSFTGCSFEPNSSGAGVAILCQSGYPAQGVALRDCWAGDNTAAGAWIKWRGSALSITGGNWTLGANITLVQLQEASNGIFVAGVGLRGTAGATVDLNTFTTSQDINIFSTPTVGQAFQSNAFPASGFLIQGPASFLFGNLRQVGTRAGFFNAATVVQPALTSSSTAADIVAALKSLGLSS